MVLKLMDIKLLVMSVLYDDTEITNPSLIETKVGLNRAKVF